MLETSARLLRLLSLFQAQRYWSGVELSERLEVTARTLRRDVDRLRSLGYPVNSTSGAAGGYQLGSGATQKFEVSEEQLFNNTFEVSSLTPDAIFAYVQNKAISETGRRAKFYSLTRLGRSQMAQETENWGRIAATMARFLAPSN